MFGIVLFGLLACASAAPQYRGHGHHHHPPPTPFPRRDDFPFGNNFFGDDIFDTRRFWMELSREMEMFDQIMTEFSKRFPSVVSTEGIDPKTNEYKITIPISGFEEKDIIVKAREGMLMIQALQKGEGGIERNYLDIRSLPDCVNVNGSWTYKDGILNVVFPILSKPNNEVTTTEVPTELPEQFKPESREEIDNQNSDNNQDADIGVKRGDLGKETELQTNEIPKNLPVEATTYAVNLNDEVEFVPVRY